MFIFKKNLNSVHFLPQVKVMLRVIPSSNPSDNATFVTVDTKKKQVTLFDPTFMSGFITPANRRAGVAAPKMFAFDAIFPQDSSQVSLLNRGPYVIFTIIKRIVDLFNYCRICRNIIGFPVTKLVT